MLIDRLKVCLGPSAEFRPDFVQGHPPDPSEGLHQSVVSHLVVYLVEAIADNGKIALQRQWISLIELVLGIAASEVIVSRQKCRQQMCTWHD